MDNVGAIFGIIGLWLLWRRWPAPRPHSAKELFSGPFPSVSIIVPARNEALTLPTLLTSLRALDYPEFEVVVVDDGSTDGTAAVAREHGDARVSVIAARARPSGWRGKQWACAEGARHAGGEILVFTDADTEHHDHALKSIVRALLRQGGGMATCLPYHCGTTLWERLSGPFHVLMLTVTRPFGRQALGRIFAIGQYLAFDRKTYLAIGGHAGVRDEIVEDLPLAAMCIRSGFPYGVLPSETPLFRVRMYASIGEFVAGWRRNVRAGLGSSKLVAPAEIAMMIYAASGAGSLSWGGIACASVAILLLARAQRRIGNFSVVGAIAWPFAAGLLTVATLLAVFDMLARRPVIWKGRAYSAGGE